MKTVSQSSTLYMCTTRFCAGVMVAVVWQSAVQTGRCSRSSNGQFCRQTDMATHRANKNHQRRRTPS